MALSRIYFDLFAKVHKKLFFFPKNVLSTGLEVTQHVSVCSLFLERGGVGV